MLIPITEGGRETSERLTPEKLFGFIDPLLTPYLDKILRTTVDTKSLIREVRHVLPHADALFTGGYVGDGPFMNIDETSMVTCAVVNTRNMYARRFTPILVGVLRKEPQEIANFSQRVQALGADGIIIAPMYGGEPWAAIYAAINSSNLPLVLYNNPQLQGGAELSAEFIKEAKEVFPTRVIGIKSSTEDFGLFKQTLELKSESFKVFQGNTADAARSLELGADGIVPAEGAINAWLFSNLYKAFVGNPDHSPAEMSGSLARFLEHLKAVKEKHKLNTAQAIKRELVGMNVFESARMYY